MSYKIKPLTINGVYLPYLDGTSDTCDLFEELIIQVENLIHDYENRAYDT